jgi:hypothetical protein
MTRLLRERGVFERHPFVLIDVGCSDGIDEAWRAFGPSLVAHGYDIDVAECERLQAAEPFEHVRYHAGRVGLPETHPFAERRRQDAAQWPDANIWGRITAGYLAARGAESGGAEPDKGEPNTGEPKRVIGVDDIVRTERLATVDFVKIDVDGPDFEVLESAREVLRDSRVLGVGMEVNWFGTPNPTEHTFHNTDRFLREQGLALFGMTTRRYSRTDLPAPFEREAFAFTRFGQPYQGDAIYLRDLVAADADDGALDYPPDKLIKLACLYELAGLPDCAAEVLNHFDRRLTRFGYREALLDALTPPLLGDQLSYREYIARFKELPELFLPSAAPDAGNPERPPPSASTATRSPLAAASRRLNRFKGRSSAR